MAPKRKPTGKSPGPPEGERTHGMGPIIRQSLIAMGYVEKPQVRLSEVAEIISRRTGWRLTKQRLGQILAAPVVSPEHLEKIARGLGVSVAELVSGRPKRGEKGSGE